MASAMQKRARAKFDKLAALNADQDTGGHIGMAARRAKAKMSDVWLNRSTGSITGFFDQKKARAIKRGVLA